MGLEVRNRIRRQIPPRRRRFRTHFHAPDHRSEAHVQRQYLLVPQVELCIIELLSNRIDESASKHGATLLVVYQLRVHFWCVCMRTFDLRHRHSVVNILSQSCDVQMGQT